jgi:hypothetical protein
MGYAIVMSPCFGCGRIFSFNPNKVPSITPPGRSQREPICENCVRRVNPMRVKNGLAPIEILPGAYEASEEGELNI